MNETLPKNAKFIPENVIKKGKILNIDWIRWAEAVLFISLTGGFMWSSGFTVKVKMIVLVVLGTSIAAFFLHGIKNRSVTQVITDMIKDKKCRKKYSLASPDIKKKSEGDESFGKQSLYQRMIKTLKYYIIKFDQRYGE